MDQRAEEIGTITVTYLLVINRPLSANTNRLGRPLRDTVHLPQTADCVHASMTGAEAIVYTDDSTPGDSSHDRVGLQKELTFQHEWCDL